MNTPTDAVVADIEAAIEKLLQSEHTLVLGTASLDGGVMVHGMHFVSDGLMIYTASLRSTRKLLNIQKESRVAYAVWRLGSSHEARHEARNLQVQGRGEIITDEAERDRLIELMGQKQPWTRGSPEMRMNRWIRIRPVEALWQQGAEDVDARRFIRFTPEARISEVFRYRDFMRQHYAPSAGSSDQ